MYQQLPTIVKPKTEAISQSTAALAGLILAVLIAFPISAVRFVTEKTRISVPVLSGEIEEVGDFAILPDLPALTLNTTEKTESGEVTSEANKPTTAQNNSVTTSTSTDKKPTDDTNAAASVSSVAQKPASSKPTVSDKPIDLTKPVTPTKPSTTIHNGTANWGEDGNPNTMWNGSDEGAPDQYDPIWPEEPEEAEEPEETADEEPAEETQGEVSE